MYLKIVISSLSDDSVGSLIYTLDYSYRNVCWGLNN